MIIAQEQQLVSETPKPDSPQVTTRPQRRHATTATDSRSDCPMKRSATDEAAQRHSNTATHAHYHTLPLTAIKEHHTHNIHIVSPRHRSQCVKQLAGVTHDSDFNAQHNSPAQHYVRDALEE
jgi:hypothetical protein